VQDKGYGDGRGELLDQLDVECGVAGGHGVGAAHRYGQAVDRGLGDERRCFVRIGAGTRRVRILAPAVLAADLAEFGLHPQACGVGVLGERAGPVDVVPVCQVCGVDHDRAGAEVGGSVDGVVDQRDVLEVIEVDRQRHRGVCGDVCARREQWGDSAAVEADRVLADLQHCVGPGALDPVGNAFGVLEGDHVEREDGGVRLGCRGDEIGGGDEGHGATGILGLGVWSMRRS
jgi:hypothetical protein